MHNHAFLIHLGMLNFFEYSRYQLVDFKVSNEGVLKFSRIINSV